MVSRQVKGRILFSLSMFVMLFIVLSSIALQQLQKSEDYRLTDEAIENIDLNTLDLFKTDTDIHTFDLIDSAFYTRHSTPLLRRHDTLVSEIHTLVKTVQQVKEFELNDDLSRVDSLLSQYDRQSKELIEKLRRKGFKEFGLEGSFRAYAHTLEDRQLIPATKILMLRRHEKDYLLRGEKQYPAQLNQLGNALAAEYKNSPQVIELLTNYMTTFNELVSITEEIGFHKTVGLNGRLNTTAAALVDALDELNKNGEIQTKQNHSKTYRMFTIAAAFAVICCGALIYLTARNL